MVAFTGCGSSSGTVVYPNSVTATVAGVLAFSASGSNVTAGTTNGTLNISAATATNSKIMFSIPANGDTIGTLAVNYIGLPAGASYDSLASTSALLASTGTITFTAVSPYLEGTFSFTCTDSTKITSGAFKIKAP